MDRRELLVLRHGKSDWDAGASDDFARPLARRGRKASMRIGRWLASGELVPDAVLSSPATRARATAELVCECMGIPLSRIRWERGLYDARAGTDLLALLAALPSTTGRTMLIGHNPVLEELLRHLCDDSLQQHEARKLLPTAAVARLSLPADWSRLEPGCGRVLELVRPKQLGE